MDARVDEDIGEINQEIGQDKERREHQDDPLDHRIIARKNRFHQQLPHARPAEHRLCQDCSAEQSAKLQPDRGDDGIRALRKA